VYVANPSPVVYNNHYKYILDYLGLFVPEKLSLYLIYICIIIMEEEGFKNLI
jgi:hypothetical protein